MEGENERRGETRASEPYSRHGTVRERDVEAPETAGVPARLEDVLDGQRQPAALDHTANHERALALFGRQAGSSVARAPSPHDRAEPACVQPPSPRAPRRFAPDTRCHS